jgi:hypothetical protein
LEEEIEEGEILSGEIAVEAVAAVTEEVAEEDIHDTLISPESSGTHVEEIE